MASRWIRSSDGHESTPGKRWRCRVSPNCGRFLERPPGRSEAETWHDGSSNRMPSQERPLFNVADVVAVTVSSLGLPVRTPVDTRRFLVSLHGASLDSAVPAPSRPSRAGSLSNSAKTASIGSPSRRPGVDRPLEVRRHTSTTAVEFRRIGAHLVGDVGSLRRRGRRTAESARPLCFGRRASRVWQCRDRAALSWIRLAPFPQRRMNLCVPILNWQSRMLYDWPQCLPPCIRR